MSHIYIYIYLYREKLIQAQNIEIRVIMGVIYKILLTHWMCLELISLHFKAIIWTKEMDQCLSTCGAFTEA